MVKSLQALWQFVVNDFARSDERDAIKLNFVDNKRINTDTIFKDTVVLPGADEKGFYKQLKRLQTTLETKDTLLSVPKGLEARRRISFFANSLFMTMPRAPQVFFSPPMLDSEFDCPLAVLGIVVFIEITSYAGRTIRSSRLVYCFQPVMCYCSSNDITV